MDFPLGQSLVMDFSLGQSLVMGFWLGQSLVVALLQYYFGRRFWGSFLSWVDHEGRPYVIRSILVDGWGCHYGIRFNQCGNVNHSFSTICTVSFNIIIPFSICPNIHTLFWQDYGLCFCFRCGTLGACATTFSITILFCSLIYYWC